MDQKIQRGVDPDFFQVIAWVLSALSDLATIFHAAQGTNTGPPSSFDPDSRQAEPTRKLRDAYNELFEAMDRLVRLFSIYEESMKNIDEKSRVGFGSFLVNLEPHHLRSYSELRRKLNQAALSIGIWTANILQHLPKHAPAFARAAVLNHTELNDILRSDLTYSEIILRCRDLRHRVDDFFDGLFKAANY